MTSTSAESSRSTSSSQLATPRLARTAPASPVVGGGRGAGRVVVATDQLADERVRAEAPVAHAHTVLRGQDLRQQAVRKAVDHEGGDAQPVARALRPQVQEVNPRQLGEPRAQTRRQRALVGRDGVHPDTRQCVARSAQRDGTDRVRRAGFVTVRRIGPDGVVERDPPHRAAALQPRLRRRQPRAARNQRSGTERGVELVPGDREVVDPERLEIDRAVWRELRRVDEDLGTCRVGQLRQFRDRPYLTRDIGSARDREQANLAAGAVKRGGSRREQLLG